jgi:hypothetical protein
MDLPHLETPWTKVSVNDKTFYFQRDANLDKVFSLSGYISKDTEAATRAEAVGLNDSLNTTPSGTLTDGFGYTYSVLVESWTIKPIASVLTKWTVSMSFKILGQT